MGRLRHPESPYKRMALKHMMHELAMKLFFYSMFLQFSLRLERNVQAWPAQLFNFFAQYGSGGLFPLVLAVCRPSANFEVRYI